MSVSAIIGQTRSFNTSTLKTIVVNKQDNTRLPFLRGILIRDLNEAGVPFDEAFELATQVREDIAEVEEITTAQLRQKVIGILDQKYDKAIRALYQSPVVAPAKIKVISLGGVASAFSRGRHQRFLQSSGVKADEAENITTQIFNQLLASGISSISTCQLGYLTHLCLQQELGPSAAKQYLVWSEFQRSGRPLLLLICGAVGSGKSSIATEIAHRLEIVRTQSTDMLREIMRSMIPKKLLPVLHCSSFDAWQTLPIQDKQERDKDLLIAEGYRSQADLLALACEAVMRRAIRESTSLILEGVHAHPALLQRLPAGADAVIVHVTLAVMKSSELKDRLRGRGAEAPKRRAKRYLNKFDSIWRLQSFVISEAERCDTPIIPNDDKEVAILQLTSTVNQELSRHYDGSLAQVFGPVAERLRKRAGSKTWQQVVPLLLPTARSSARATKKA